MNQVLCDRGCPTVALVEVTSPHTLNTLDLCGHHFNTQRAALALKGFEVTRDDRQSGQKFEVVPEKEIEKVKDYVAVTVADVPIGPDDDPDFQSGGGGVATIE